MEERTSHARMLTTQEAAFFGCTFDNETCPIWLYNYLFGSESYGGTKNCEDCSSAWGYHLLTTNTSSELIQLYNIS